MKKRLEDLYGEVYSDDIHTSSHKAPEHLYEQVYNKDIDESDNKNLFIESLYELVINDEKTIDENGHTKQESLYEQVLIKELEIMQQQHEDAQMQSQQESSLVNEYAKQEPWLYANSTSARKHGKSIMTGDRKHMNLIAKDYVQKNPRVEACRKTGSDQHLAGSILMKVLADYNMDFEECTLKGISKSNIAIWMFLDPTTSAPRGIIHKKSSTRCFPGQQKQS